MAWTPYQLFLAILLVVTGSINTISSKWADEIRSKGWDNKIKAFHHPFFQATCMFLGEFLCLIVFKSLYFWYKRKEDGLQDEKDLTKGNREFNPLVLFVPAMCDMSATSIMYVGLNLTYASSFQMFRGAVIVFVGLLSILVLKRYLGLKEWGGIVLVILGLMLVGLADFVAEATGTRNLSNADIIAGDVMIALAQILVATQMVVEEKFVTKWDIPPLQAAGWEGIFGLSVLIFLQIPFYFIKTNPPITQHKGDRLEDAIDAMVQIGNSWQLAFSLTITIISIAFFNFAGISITKELSATTRMVLDSIRTIIIWIVSMLVFKQKFHWLQLIGFITLICGMCLYNRITLASFAICTSKKTPEDVPQ